MYSICGVRVSVRIRQVVVPLFWLMNINYMLCDIQGWFIQILKVCHHFLTLIPFQTCLNFIFCRIKAGNCWSPTALHLIDFHCMYVRARLRDTQIRMPPANLKTTQSLRNNVVSNDSLYEGVEKQGHDKLYYHCFIFLSDTGGMLSSGELYLAPFTCPVLELTASPWLNTAQ